MRWTGMTGWTLCRGVMVLWLMLAGQAGAQPNAVPDGSGGPQSTLTDELTSLAGRAKEIFVGQVTSVERRGGVVEIAFSVEQTIAGTVGSSFTLHEWAGLWPQGQVRYTLGERALVFLHGASSAGFASPVDGADGVVPVIAQGVSAPQLLDIRRLAAALLRAPGTPLPTEADGAIALSDATSTITRARAAAIPVDGISSLPKPLEPPLRLPLPLHGGPAQDPDTQGPRVPQTGQIHRPLIMASGAATAGSGVTYAQR